MTAVPNPNHVFAEARAVTMRIAAAACLDARQLSDLDRTMLDFERDRRLDEVVVARLARQGVPVSRLLKVAPENLLRTLRAHSRAMTTPPPPPGTPVARPDSDAHILGIALARALARDGWAISGGNVGLNPYSKRK